MHDPVLHRPNQGQSYPLHSIITIQWDSCFESWSYRFVLVRMLSLYNFLLFWLKHEAINTWTRKERCSDNYILVPDQTFDTVNSCFVPSSSDIHSLDLVLCNLLIAERQKLVPSGESLSRIFRILVDFIIIPVWKIRDNEGNVQRGVWNDRLPWKA